MTYKPTKKEVLLGHYRPPGFPVFNYDVCEELAVENLLRKLPPVEDWKNQKMWMLTHKGIDVADLLLGKRNTLPFRVPDWVLVAATE